MNEQLEFLKSAVSRLDSAGIPYMLEDWAGRHNLSDMLDEVRPR